MYDTTTLELPCKCSLKCRTEEKTPEVRHSNCAFCGTKTKQKKLEYLGYWRCPICQKNIFVFWVKWKWKVWDCPGFFRRKLYIKIVIYFWPYMYLLVNIKVFCNNPLHQFKILLKVFYINLMWRFVRIKK